MNKLTDTRERLLFAKQRFNAAAQAAMNCDPQAEGMARNALVELDAARAELKQLHGASPANDLCALLHVERC